METQKKGIKLYIDIPSKYRPKSLIEMKKNSAPKLRE